MDAAWISIIVGVLSSLIGGLVVGMCTFFALRTWVARLEERHNALSNRCEEDRALLAETREIHAKRLAAHELEIGLMKRGQSMDYAR